MSSLTSVGIVILAMLIQATLQLAPGVFAIFYHYALGKNSQEKVLDLSGYFVVGAEMVAALMLMAIYFIMLKMPETAVLDYILGGMLAALGLFMLMGYYRRGKGTELFITRKSAAGFYEKAKHARKKSDILVLGIVTGMAELFLTLPLMMTVVRETMNWEMWWQIAAMALYVLMTMSGVGAVRGRFLRGNNLAEIERARVRNKNFYRVMIAVMYFAMAGLMIGGRFLW